MERYREVIRENIDYDLLLQEKPYDEDRLDEIVELLVETVCSNRKQIRVGGSDFPAEVVKSRLLKLDAEHIRFVFDCLGQNTTKVRNIRQYLLTTLYNAPATIGNYYSSPAVRSDRSAVFFMPELGKEQQRHEKALCIYHRRMERQ